MTTPSAAPWTHSVRARTVALARAAPPAAKNVAVRIAVGPAPRRASSNTATVAATPVAPAKRQGSASGAEQARRHAREREQDQRRAHVEPLPERPHRRVVARPAHGEGPRDRRHGEDRARGHREEHEPQRARVQGTDWCAPALSWKK